MKIIKSHRFFTLFTTAALFNLALHAGTPLTRGTAVPVKILNTVTSQQNGNTEAVVAYDIRGENQEVLIRRGTPVVVNTECKRARGCGREGSVTLRFSSTLAEDGQYINLRGEWEQLGEERTGLAVGLGVGLGLSFLPFVGFAFLAIKGRPATITAGTEITSVYVADEYEIETKKPAALLQD